MSTCQGQIRISNTALIKKIAVLVVVRGCHSMHNGLDQPTYQISYFSGVILNRLNVSIDNVLQATQYASFYSVHLVL